MQQELDQSRTGTMINTPDTNGAAARRNAKRAPGLLGKVVALTLVAASLTAVHHDAQAGDREKAKRMFDRLTGTPPSPALLNDLTTRVTNNGAVAAALYILDKNQAHSSSFYSVTLKNFATPWTNRDRNVF